MKKVVDWMMDWMMIEFNNPIKKKFKKLKKKE